MTFDHHTRTEQSRTVLKKLLTFDMRNVLVSLLMVTASSSYLQAVTIINNTGRQLFLDNLKFCDTDNSPQAEIEERISIKACQKVKIENLVSCDITDQVMMTSPFHVTGLNNLSEITFIFDYAWNNLDEIEYVLWTIQTKM